MDSTLVIPMTSHHRRTGLARADLEESDDEGRKISWETAVQNREGTVERVRAEELRVRDGERGGTLTGDVRRATVQTTREASKQPNDHSFRSAPHPPPSGETQQEREEEKGSSTDQVLIDQPTLLSVGTLPLSRQLNELARPRGRSGEKDVEVL